MKSAFAGGGFRLYKDCDRMKISQAKNTFSDLLAKKCAAILQKLRSFY